MPIPPEDFDLWDGLDCRPPSDDEPDLSGFPDYIKEAAAKGRALNRAAARKAAKPEE